MTINILWDLDGTLVDSMPVIADCLNKTALDYGKPVWSDERLRPLIGPELGDILATMLDLSTREDITRAKQVYRSYYQHEMLHSPVFDGIQSSLQHFASIGAVQFVATAKYQHYAQLIINETPLASFFSGVYGSTEDGRYGDKKELLGLLLAEEQLKPAQTLMIGDTRYDIEAGRAHDVSTIGVLWGYSDREALTNAGAHFIAETTDQLPDVVRNALTCGC